MNYNLNEKRTASGPKKESTFRSIARLWPLIATQKKSVFIALGAVIMNSALNLVAPIVIGYTIDHFIQTANYGGVLMYSGLLFLIYLAALLASYIQTQVMGGVGQRILFNLRSSVFTKLQSLPVAFFNQNKAGDLISRINNDTDRLNQFFSQALVQFIGNIFVIIGAAVFVLSINIRLGAATLTPAIGLLIFTLIISPYVKRKNAQSLSSVGSLSAEIQESINNFKVILAFNRRDYFRKKFDQANEQNYKAAVGAGLVNTVFFTPVYGLVSGAAQLAVLAYGIYLISIGSFTIGLLVSFLTYVSRFYDPLRQIAALWTQFQIALAAWDRISDLLALENNLMLVPSSEKVQTNGVLEFDHVSFGYPGGAEILHDISFTLEPGKTYALVGPTGGGKTTTASLMARLYDPTRGTVRLFGKDIRSYESSDRTAAIGFILQEPFLFTGTVRDNILYANEQYHGYSKDELAHVLTEMKLENLLSRFDQGLDAQVGTGDSVSLGQKQLIAFMRAVLRRPKLLILDEATANVDTVTEQLLDEILKKLPEDTTRVIIAHRLNTIENADEIFFVNSGEVVRAGSFDHAVEMLMDGHRKS